MRHVYTKEEIEFLKSNCQGTGAKDLTERLNEKFNENIPLSSILAFKQRYKLKSGVNSGQWKKGACPSGSKIFKKGNIPYNKRPIFSERIREGYIEIKVSDPSVWESKHRYIYTQKHGEIPKGYKVTFADGNKRNFDINNLILIKSGESMAMCNIGLYSKNPEITKTGLLLAKMIMKTRKLKNKKR